MNPQLQQYIATKRIAGVPDNLIKDNLIAAGWSADLVSVGLGETNHNDAPPPPPSATTTMPTQSAPVTVVATRSTQGLEYLIMFISLWVAATSLAFLLHGTVDGLFNNTGSLEEVLPLASTAILVTLPIFSLMFLRLKRSEQKNPNERNDPSRKNAIHLTLIVTFLLGLYNVITYLYGFMGGHQDYETHVSPIADLLHTVITLGITGSIFTYYWRDQHGSQTT